MKHIKKEVGKFNIPLWLFLLLALIEVTLITLEIYVIHLLKNYELNIDDSLNVEIYSLLISNAIGLFLAITIIVAYALNYSFKERHRREESQEWERSGRRVEAIEKSIQITEEQINTFNKERNIEDNWGRKMELTTEIELLNSKIISLKEQKRDALISFGWSYKRINKHNRRITRERYFKKIEQHTSLIINKFKFKLGVLKEKTKLPKISNTDEWILMPIRDCAVYAQKIIEMIYSVEKYNEYSNYQGASSTSMIFINPAQCKIRFYINRSLPREDYLSGQDLDYIYLEGAEKPFLIELNSPNHSKLIIDRNKKISTEWLNNSYKFTINYSGKLVFSQEEYKSYENEKYRENILTLLNNFVENKKEDYNEETIIKYLSNSTEAYKTWDYIMAHFLTFEAIKENSKQIFENIDHTKTLNSLGINKKLSIDEKMFVKLCNKQEFRRYLNAPEKYRKNWNAYPALETRFPIKQQFNDFVSENPSINIEFDYISKYVTFFGTRLTNNEKKVNLFANKYESEFHYE